MTQFINTLLYINYLYVYVSIILTAFSGLLFGFNKKSFGINLFLANTLFNVILVSIVSSIPFSGSIFSPVDQTILTDWVFLLANKTNTIVILFVGILFINLLLRFGFVVIKNDLQLQIFKPVDTMINRFVHTFSKDKALVVKTKNIFAIIITPLIGLFVILFSYTYVSIIYSIFR